MKIEAYGDWWDHSNPFHWEKVTYNLPGTKDYRAGLPWVMKVRLDSHLASEVYVYVNDGRVTVHCRELSCEDARRFTLVYSKMAYKTRTEGGLPLTGVRPLGRYCLSHQWRRDH